MELGTLILFLLGPSGVGKSKVAGWASEDLGLSHLPIDRWPSPTDGIDTAGLRREWDLFLEQQEAGPLAVAIRGKSQGSSGTCLTFPSRLVLSIAHLTATDAEGVTTVILWCPTPEDCLHAFLDREKESGRGLGPDHWKCNNASEWATYNEPPYDAYRVPTFVNGMRRSRESLIAALGGRLGIVV
jgi:hypothetical protein